MKHLIMVFFALLTATAVFAHSKMNATTPADGAILQSAPEALEFTFSDKLRLIKVELAHSSGHMQALDLEQQTSFTDAFTLPLTGMGAGIYEVEWRGLGIDGHAMKGFFSFEVQ